MLTGPTSVPRNFFASAAVKNGHPASGPRSTLPTTGSSVVVAPPDAPVVAAPPDAVVPADDEPLSSLQAANVSADAATRASNERRRLFDMGFEATGAPRRRAVTAG